MEELEIHSDKTRKSVEGMECTPLGCIPFFRLPMWRNL